MFRRVVLIFLGVLVLTTGAIYADLPSGPPMAIEETIAQHATGGATGACSIQFYNLCRWLWVHVAARGDEVGVIFDLPLDCGKQPGETCVNTGFWWYWRYTAPARAFINYNMYNVDAQGCKQGAPLGTLTYVSPTERWNHYPGLGGPISSDHVAIIASWDYLLWLPYLATDNNVHNLADPANCPGYVPHNAIHSVAWKWHETTYCPPSPFSDAAGPVEIIMEASFSCGPVATEPESWTGVKQLFR